MNSSADNSERLSKGCQLCQQGKWLCIFLTYRCDAKCAFCPAPFRGVDQTASAFGCDLPTLYRYLQDSPIAGISFSGGESFLVFDRMVEWLSFLKTRFPQFYFWAYTNGFVLDEDKMRIIALLGLNELRFNIAASNYNSTFILEKIESAAEIFDCVAVEVPSIPEDYPKLEKVLDVLNTIRVKYLNLHEYILVGADATVTAEGATFLLNKESAVRYDPRSLSNSERIAAYCRDHGFRLVVNSCTMEKKELQMQQRRLVMGQMLHQSSDKLTDEGMLETVFVSPQKLTYTEVHSLLSAGNVGNDCFVHPDAIDRTFIDNHGGTVATVHYVPPMSIDERRRLHTIRLHAS